MKSHLHAFTISLCMAFLFVFNAEKLAAQDVTFTPTTDNLGIANGGDAFGCAWGDYDSDGDLDLFVAKSPLALYRNDGGQFVDVAAELGLADPVGTYPTGAAWGDMDNDGNLDLVSANNGIKIFLNDGSKFTYVYDEAGLNLWDDGQRLWQPTLGDYDKDGDLDIAFSGADQGSGPIAIYAHILRNDDGLFSEDLGPDLMSDDYLLESWTPSWLDYDNDGDLDLWLPTIRTPDFPSTLFRNDGTLFYDITPDVDMTSKAAIATSWGDFDNDGDLDLFIITYTGGQTGENDMLYQNDGTVFTDIAPDLGIQGPAANSRGLCWGDYDNDGDLDLLIGERSGNQLLYRNDGTGTDRTFTEVGEATGAGVTGNDYRNVMFVDYDADGFLDIFCNSTNKLLLHNEGNSNHWLGVRLRGTVSNRNGSGSRIRVVTGDLSQIRDIEAGGMGGLRNGFSWGHFGLGAATSVDSVIIRWPMGTVDVFTNVAADKYYDYTEGTGSVDVKDRSRGAALPAGYALLQNYPNPFNPTTTIPFDLSKKSHVRLLLVNVLGDVVREIVNGEYGAGHHEIKLDVGNLAAGVYFYKIEANGFSDVKKLAVVK
jgi:hypothetical protein